MTGGRVGLRLVWMGFGEEEIPCLLW